MKKQLLLNAFGVVCLTVLCSCGDKKAEEPKTETPAAVAQNDVATPAIDGAATEAKPVEETKPAEEAPVAKTEAEAPADKA